MFHTKVVNELTCPPGCLCPAAATETNRFIFFFKCLVAEREKEIFFCFCFRSRAHWPLRTQQHTELSLATARSLEGRTSADRRAHTDGRERDSAHSRTSSGADRRTAFHSDSPPNRLRLHLFSGKPKSLKSHSRFLRHLRFSFFVPNYSLRIPRQRRSIFFRSPFKLVQNVITMAAFKLLSF